MVFLALTCDNACTQPPGGTSTLLCCACRRALLMSVDVVEQVDVVGEVEKAREFAPDYVEDASL